MRDLMIEMIKTKLLEKFTCYFYSGEIYNFTEIKLYDDKTVISCYECHKTVESGKEMYYSKMLGIVT